MTFFEFNDRFRTEEDAIRHFYKVRYRNGLVCPHCGEKTRVHQRNDRPRYCNCGACGNTFSVFGGTVFEKTTTSLRKWMYAVHLFLNGKKGISGLQLQREIGVTYKTAWRMLNRIRTAMGNVEGSQGFDMVVEADETYVGGKPRKRNMGGRTGAGRGRGTSKTPVIGVRHRASGGVYAKVAVPDGDGKRLTGKQLISVLNNVCAEGTVVMTDDYRGYDILGNGGANVKRLYRVSVNHSAGQFRAGNGAHTNGIEGFWSLLKRAILGVYHGVSAKYLQTYVDECCFRQNNRDIDTSFDTLLWQSVRTRKVPERFAA